MTTKTEILSALEQMPNQERLEIIRLASRLIRRDQEASVVRSIEIMRPLYEQGGELTVMTDLDFEDFVEYSDYA